MEDMRTRRHTYTIGPTQCNALTDKTGVDMRPLVCTRTYSKEVESESGVYRLCFQHADQLTAGVTVAVVSPITGRISPIKGSRR